jgi:hypothetical protein
MMPAKRSREFIGVLGARFENLNPRPEERDHDRVLVESRVLEKMITISLARGSTG